MKRTIEIECPEGCRPVYNAKTSNVEMVPENIIGRIQTHEDARTYLGYAFKNAISYNKSVNSLAKLQTILNALNEKHEFDLLTGTVWYPWVNFFKMESVPKNATVIAHFRYQDKKFALVSAKATSGGTCGLGAFLSINGIGAANANVGMFACKSEEIAKYVSTQFGKLIFEACFARYFKNGEFEWLDLSKLIKGNMDIFEAVNKSFKESDDYYGEGDIIKISVCPNPENAPNVWERFRGCVRAIVESSTGETGCCYIKKEGENKPVVCYAHNSAKWVEYDNYFVVTMTKEDSKKTFGLQGWICPKCGRVYSPYTSMCSFCCNVNFPHVQCTTDSMRSSGNELGMPAGVAYPIDKRFNK